MILYFNYDINAICEKILQEQLNELDIKYSLVSMFEVEIEEPITENKLKELNVSLNGGSIKIVESQKSILVQKIKDTIVEMIFMEEKIPWKTSSYIADKLGRNYTSLSNLFSSVTHTSIETFIQLQKTERAKQLLVTTELNVTEIGWKLNFSSTAHFCNTFKKVTGLTPTAFLRIIEGKRK